MQLFAPGTILTRAEIHQQYGGGTQGGILTPARGKLILIFSDPTAGAGSGYHFDGWTSDGDRFFYTGNGPEGDQQFVRQNRIVRDSSNEGREIHLFVADGTVPGSATKLHRYEGQFQLDPQHPWRREDSPSASGTEIRSVIVFNLHRITFASGISAPDAERADEIAAPETTVAEVPLEAGDRLTITRTHQPQTQAERTEYQLADQLRAHLADQGVTPVRHRIQPVGQGAALYTDMWDRNARELFECKGSVTRDNVRMAIGQLLDYRRHLTPEPTRCTVALPTDPGPDLTDLIHHAGFDLIYHDVAARTFRRVSHQASDTGLERGSGATGPSLASDADLAKLYRRTGPGPDLRSSAPPSAEMPQPRDGRRAQPPSPSR